MRGALFSASSAAVVLSDRAPQRAPADFLIASDDRKFRQVVRAALRRSRYSGTFVRCGDDVIDRVTHQPPQCLLLDQSLAGDSGVEVARQLDSRVRPRFVLFGEHLTTPLTVAAMQLGAVTVIEKPIDTAAMLTLLRQLGRAMRAAAEPSAPRPGPTPRSVAERWAMKVLRGCAADHDLKTLSAWALEAGSSYSSLCETCRLLDIQPLAARDLMRVLRAAVQARTLGCRVADLLDVSDRRTLSALMARAGVDPRQYGDEISIAQLLASQRFVAPRNAGLTMLRAMLPQ